MYLIITRTFPPEVGLGLIGKEKAIACEVICSISK